MIKLFWQGWGVLSWGTGLGLILHYFAQKTERIYHHTYIQILKGEETRQREDKNIIKINYDDSNTKNNKNKLDLSWILAYVIHKCSLAEKVTKVNSLTQSEKLQSDHERSTSDCGNDTIRDCSAWPNIEISGMGLTRAGANQESENMRFNEEGLTFRNQTRI